MSAASPSPDRVVGERLLHAGSDLQVLAGTHHECAHPGAVGGDDRVRLVVAGEDDGVVGRRLDGDAEVAEPVGGPRAGGGGVFADAAGEHEDVQPADGGGHRGDAAGEAVQVDVEGQAGVGV